MMIPNEVIPIVRNAMMGLYDAKSVKLSNSTTSCQSYQSAWSVYLPSCNIDLVQYRICDGYSNIENLEKFGDLVYSLLLPMCNKKISLGILLSLVQCLLENASSQWNYYLFRNTLLFV